MEYDDVIQQVVLHFNVVLFFTFIWNERPTSWMSIKNLGIKLFTRENM